MSEGWGEVGDKGEVSGDGVKWGEGGGECGTG